jgi:hypothetical protein
MLKEDSPLQQLKNGALPGRDEANVPNFHCVFTESLCVGTVKHLQQWLLAVF